MTAITFNKKIDKLWKDLNGNIDLVHRNKTDVLNYAEEILMDTDAAIRKLKDYASQYTFRDWSEEITFFKLTKPKFVSKFIYYSKLLSIESSRPYADPLVLKKYYETERSNLVCFYQENRDFISYYRRNATYLDKKYFLRFKFDFKMRLSPEFYSYDYEFSTSHDHLVSQLLANDLLDHYLTHKINSQSESDYSSDLIDSVEWTAPKVALIELICALHQTRCFNSGRSEINEIVRWAEKTLNINLGNYHKTLGEIRLRKTDRTKFISLLHQNMEKYLEDLDE
ncbi:MULTISPECIES: RteC domain-containing protein [Chryseobacterium]|jgi:hypothetical protein|uniref:RteC protein n=2 Tax=Chryseobacterium TaxID=59732 RepID=A0A101CHA3_9FLAO|nr:MULTISPECIES: RteC domain-containing protein [Chryseobacterium]KUJ56232.1 hypothetical protein AR686_06565 [Chryseobacterium aquaticum subsp. greenlandense]QQV01817.1 RteC domain-containing protein [Chryseobacterium sp. FDAARGOS 1104]VFB04971.1 RteC protein [Chryseobacterium taihuense]